MHRYLAYDQCIKSEIELPGLPSGDGSPNITIEYERLPLNASGLPAEQTEVHKSPDGAVSVYRSERVLYWLYDSLGAVRIEGGRRIGVCCADEGAESTARWLALAPGLRSALIQQGYLVLHASAVKVGDCAVLFAGPTGAGKSTTAAAFATAGHPVLADDNAALSRTESEYVVFPGSSMLRINRRDAAKLNLTNGGSYHRSGTGRGKVEVAADAWNESCSVAKLYLLEWGEPIAIETPPPEEILSSILRHSYPLYTETNVSVFKRHFDTCADYADTVDICRLRRPRSFDDLDRIVSLVRSDLRE